MPIYETFKKRKQRAENADKPVVYRDDILPDSFRIQVQYIWMDTRSDVSALTYDQLWSDLRKTLHREMGLPIRNEVGQSHYGWGQNFLLRNQNVDDVLSLIELAFRMVDGPIRDIQSRANHNHQNRLSADDAIVELNHPFLEHGIGYQFQGGQIIAVNSQYLHSEVVEPAITLLYNANFTGALQEFMAAHEHYRRGDYKEAIANAGNAFESTMKTICDKRAWTYDRATASALIEVLYSNTLIPPEMKNHFTGLRSALEGGVPTLRNQAGRGAHGQGSTPVAVPDYLAAYCLHLAAANIVFLVEAHKAMP